MSNSKIITQKIPNSRVCSTDMSKSKSINADERKSKRFNVNAYSMYKNESKRVTVITCSTDKGK